MDNIVFFPVKLEMILHLLCNMASYPPSIHYLLPIQINSLLPACMLPFLFRFCFPPLLLSPLLLRRRRNET